MHAVLSAAEDEQLRNVRAFMFERFNRVGMTDEQLAQRPPPRPRMQPQLDEQDVQIERLASIAGAVREQLLRQVREADLQRDVVLRAHMETVPISQDERQRDLVLIQSQAYVNVELAAISYLEHEGEVVNAIMALNEGTEQRAQLEEGLRQRQLQLGLRVTEEVDAIPLADLSEERREVIREARRAFRRAADNVQRAARNARLASTSHMFVDGHPRAWRNSAVHEAPLPQRMHAQYAEQHLMVPNHGPIGLGKTDRGARHRVIQREAVRLEMEALEAQVEACAIDENTYNEKAMALKHKFEAVGSGQDDETSRPLFSRSPNWYEARDDAEEEVEWAARPEEVD